MTWGQEVVFTKLQYLYYAPHTFHHASCQKGHNDYASCFASVDLMKFQEEMHIKKNTSYVTRWGA